MKLASGQKIFLIYAFLFALIFLTISSICNLLNIQGLLLPLFGLALFLWIMVIERNSRQPKTSFRR